MGKIQPNKVFLIISEVLFPIKSKYTTFSTPLYFNILSTHMTTQCVSETVTQVLLIITVLRSVITTRIVDFYKIYDLVDFQG